MNRYDRPKDISALEAISEAQKLAFSPIAFQATVTALRLGILRAVADAKEGISAPEVAAKVGISEYGARVLLDMGLSTGLFWSSGQRYMLDKIGHFVLADKMTRINLDFVKDVCYLAMDDLETSIANQTPEGLKRFGQWPTLYPGLTEIREPARTSWFSFDHYYSGNAFPEALNIVFAEKRSHILDVGGNTGAWALACARHDPEVRVTIADLPQQTKAARAAIAGTGFEDRVDTFDIDLLDPEQSFPRGADIVWMSQFLDCFAEEQITAILARARNAVAGDGRIFIMEPLWDLQEHEAASYSLNATSLYFTAIANGASRMYSSEDMQRLITAAGLGIAHRYENLGIGQTLIECVRDGSR